MATWIDTENCVTILFPHYEDNWAYIEVDIQKDYVEYINTNSGLKIYIPLLHHINKEDSYALKIARNVVIKLPKVVNEMWPTISHGLDTFIVNDRT